MKAPIVLFAYKRVDHLTLCLEALRDNLYASESELIVYSDGAKNDQDASGVNEVRQYLAHISGFRKIEVIKQKENLGLSKSIIHGVTEIVQRYGKVIVLEDDLVPSRYFLKFMNDALSKFETEEKVISIHGYMYPVEDELPELFLLRGADCWGWATWKRGWDLLETNGQSLLEKIKEQRETKRFNFNNSYPYTTMLEDQIAGRNNSWAILWYASAFVQNRFTLYPGNSLIHNTGNDSSGTHSLATHEYDVELAEKEVKVNEWSPVFEDNRQALQATAKYFRRTNSKFGFVKRYIDRYFNKG